jgi:RNA recognition motif-containing protein
VKLNTNNTVDTTCPDVTPRNKGQNRTDTERKEEMLDTTNVFVKYLPADMDDWGLRELFSPFGKILSAKVMLSTKTWTSLGFGYEINQKPKRDHTK